MWPTRGGMSCRVMAKVALRTKQKHHPWNSGASPVPPARELHRCVFFEHIPKLYRQRYGKAGFETMPRQCLARAHTFCFRFPLERWPISSRRDRATLQPGALT